METKELVKLSEEEIKGLGDLRQKYAEITANLGRFSLDKNEIEKRLSLINTEIEKLYSVYDENVKAEQDLVNKLNEKYGQGRIDLESGVFTPDN